MVVCLTFVRIARDLSVRWCTGDQDCSNNVEASSIGTRNKTSELVTCRQTGREVAARIRNEPKHINTNWFGVSKMTSKTGSHHCP